MNGHCGSTYILDAFISGKEVSTTFYIIHWLPQIAALFIAAIIDAYTALHISRSQSNLENLWATPSSSKKTSTKIETPLKCCIFSIILGSIDICLVVILNIPTLIVDDKALILIFSLLIINIVRIPLYLKLAFKKNEKNLRRSISVKKRKEAAENSALIRRQSLQRQTTNSSFIQERDSF